MIEERVVASSAVAYNYKAVLYWTVSSRTVASIAAEYKRPYISQP